MCFMLWGDYVQNVIKNVELEALFCLGELRGTSCSDGHLIRVLEDK